MKALFDFFRAPKPNLPVIKAVHEALKPNAIVGAYTGTTWRHQSLRKTVDYVTEPVKYKGLQDQATKNVDTWIKDRINPPMQVDVISKDWGDSTLQATKKYGAIYTVLNMANSFFPGGAVLDGGSAQEENMWHRSTCLQTLHDEGIYLDKENNTFRYEEKMTALISALEQMTDEERCQLIQLRGDSLSNAFKVFLHKEQQICFRGGEFLVPNHSFESGSSYIADSALSYALLPQNEIFPFYELRSAAPDLSSERVDWNDTGVLEHYKNDLRRRIAAQLDTLILAGRTHAVLGAWGCGAFKNNPNTVAALYREEIEKRAHFFQHIVFPVINRNYRSENFSIFHQSLNGLKLGEGSKILTRASKSVDEPKKTRENPPSQFFTAATSSHVFEELPNKGPKHHN